MVDINAPLELGTISSGVEWSSMFTAFAIALIAMVLLLFFTASFWQKLAVITFSICMMFFYYNLEPAFEYALQYGTKKELFFLAITVLVLVACMIYQLFKRKIWNCLFAGYWAMAVMVFSLFAING